METRIAICLLMVFATCRFATGAISKTASPPIFNQGSVAPLSPKPIRAIRLEITVNAPVDRVWRAWTTRDGVRSFFAPDCQIDLRVLGKYDILFNPLAPVGRRGAENNLILAIQQNKLFSFTWDAPPQFPRIREQRTSVVLRFLRLDENKTKIIFNQTGWGEGEDWIHAYDYFVQAWGEVVLPFLKHSLEVGPVDWNQPPTNVEKAVTVEG